MPYKFPELEVILGELSSQQLWGYPAFFSLIGFWEIRGTWKLFDLADFAPSYFFVSIAFVMYFLLVDPFFELLSTPLSLNLL